VDVSLDSFGVLQVEPTDICNLSCAMCSPQRENPGQVHGVPGGMMSLDGFRQLLDGLLRDDCRFDHVILQWMGDPALHPQLPRMVGMAAARLKGRAGYLRLDTNGLALGPRRAQALLQAWQPHSALPLLVVYSLDAISRDTYAQVKGADGLQRALRNIRALADGRKRLGLSGPNIQLQLVVQEGNAHEVGRFVRYWQAFLACRGGDYHDEILLKRLSVAAGGAGQAAANRLYERSLREQGVRAQQGPPVSVVTWERRPWERDDETWEGPRGPCPGPWMTPVLRFDGQLTACCVDLRGQLALGNVGERGFRQLWEGERALELRLAHVRGELGQFPLCQGCGGINWYGFPAQTVREWLQSVGREELWEAYRKRMEGNAR